MFEDKAFGQKLASIEKRFEEVSGLLGQPEVIKNRSEFAKLSKEHSDLDQLVTTWREYCKLRAELADARTMVDDAGDDAEMRALAKDELKALEKSQKDVEQKIKVLLLPKDPNDAKNILLEIRAGTGGDEAALFAGDLYRMYMRFAERQRWNTILRLVFERDNYLFYRYAEQLTLAFDFTVLGNTELDLQCREFGTRGEFCLVLDFEAAQMIELCFGDCRNRDCSNYYCAYKTTKSFHAVPLL